MTRHRISSLGTVVALMSIVCAALLVAGCGSGGSGGANQPSGSNATAANTIIIKNFAFDPATIAVSPGATVTVKNEDTATHTVTASDKSFDTGDVAPGASKTFTAPTKAGSYSYICTIHNYMQGNLTVK